MKKFLSILLALTLVVGMMSAFTVSAVENTATFYNAADDEIITSLDNVDSIYVTTTFTGRYEDNASVIVSHYDFNGKLIKVESIVPVESTIGAEVSYTTPAISVEGTDIVKVFAWTGEDTIKPLLTNPGVISRSIPLPTATVTELDVAEITDIPVTYAMNFKADPVTKAQLLAYGNWYADYELKINKDVTFNLDGTRDGYLAGQYDSWSPAWVAAPKMDVTVAANTPIKIMETAAEEYGKPGLKYTCAEVFDRVKDFDCGVFFSEEFLSQNPDLYVTLELRIYNPLDENESYLINEETYKFGKNLNITTEPVILTSENVIAEVPAGVVLTDGNTGLSLRLTDMDESESDVAISENEAKDSLDVHIEGVSDTNTTPIIVTLTEAAPVGLNKGNLSLYHVEDGVAVEMEEVEAKEDLVSHNQFTYNPVDGTVSMALATFSEVAIVSNTENAWNGEYDTSWYNTTDTYFEIANADQLAGLGAIVGGMNGLSEDTFEGKTIKLVADLNFGGEASEHVYYPVGYYNSEGTYPKSGTAITSGMKPFEGTFDGNGHTIKNIYQNTWEMKGDHEWYDATEQNYRDGMGIFGKVYGATIKNLTVDNFISVGEITTTGVIASYADSWNGRSAVFENIAITNCNPQVYNIGNGGIVGSGGWYSREATDIENTPITFKNITVDNTNKISALWGSWDVACAGIMGRYYPDSNCGVEFENCHVAAQIDVYNDVCGNYQYYWYRYAGMMIGTVEASTTDANGYTVPDMTGVTAKDCTVHFGDWNNYYYCEMVVNSLASYTHDHQFSRLDEVDAVDVDNMTVTVDGESTAIPTSGRKNYVVVNGTHSTENATCYHFVDGKVWNHEDAGYEDSIDEDGDGKPDLKEDKQHIYLPFNQLFQGDGWGVKNVPIYNDGKTYFEGITILDREIADSVVKFMKADTAQYAYTTGTTVTVGDLFTSANAEVAIDVDNVQVMVSPADENSTVSATYVADVTDWTKGTLSFTGIGNATITITDYFYCTATSITVNVIPVSEPIYLDPTSAGGVRPGTADYAGALEFNTNTATGSLFQYTLANLEIPAGEILKSAHFQFVTTVSPNGRFMQFQSLNCEAALPAVPSYGDLTANNFTVASTFVQSQLTAEQTSGVTMWMNRSEYVTSTSSACMNVDVTQALKTSIDSDNSYFNLLVYPYTGYYVAGANANGWTPYGGGNGVLVITTEKVATVDILGDTDGNLSYKECEGFDIAATVTQGEIPLTSVALTIKDESNQEVQSCTGYSVNENEYTWTFDEGLEPGNYTATVTATDLSGATVSDSVALEVRDTIITVYIPANMLVSNGAGNQFQILNGVLSHVQYDLGSYLPENSVVTDAKWYFGKSSEFTTSGTLLFKEITNLEKYNALWTATLPEDIAIASSWTKVVGSVDTLYAQGTKMTNGNGADAVTAQNGYFVTVPMTDIVAASWANGNDYYGFAVMLDGGTNVFLSRWAGNGAYWPMLEVTVITE